METLGICPGRSWQSMKERFHKKILTNLATYNMTKTQLMKADEDKAGTEQTGSSRQPYSRSDDEAILKHIVEGGHFSSVAGNELWIEIERLEVVTGRSWQSLKEHFRKIIMRNLCSFRFLTKEQRSSLKARRVVQKEEDVENSESLTEGAQAFTLEEACSKEAWEVEEEEVEEQA